MLDPLAWFATMLENHVRDVNGYHKEFIFLCDLKKIVFNHSFQNVTASSHEEAAW